jgi:predicted ThiF/HesA family dinucleotide-utilizing enzyme
MSLHETSASSLSLVSETAIDNNDMIFTKERFGNFHYQFIRRLAAAADTDEINGKSDRFVVQSYFVRQRTLTEYE